MDTRSAPALALVASFFAACGGGVADQASTGGTASGPATNALAVGWDRVDAEGEVMALTTAPEHVCWSSFSAKGATRSLVGCARKSDGVRTDFLRDGLTHPGIAASADQLYWSTESTATIDRAALSGGPAVTVVSKSGPHGHFVLLDGALYWLVDGGGGSVLFSATSGAAPVQIKNIGPGDAELLSMVDYSAYAWPLAFSFGAGVVRTHAHDGDAPAQLSGVCFYPTDLQADSEFVYWSCQDRTLHWIAQTGGAEHVEHDAGYGSIALWQGVAYVTDVNGGRVLRVHPRDGKVDVLQTGLPQPYKIAADDSGIYVGAGGAILHFAR